MKQKRAQSARRGKRGKRESPSPSRPLQRWWLPVLAGSLFAAASGTAFLAATLLRREEAPTAQVRIVRAFPHDPGAFTQGLVFAGGALYEGTGIRGQSTLREVNLSTGNVLRSVELPEQYFGEGITVWQDRIIQLTWRSRVGFVYDRKSFEKTGEFPLETEGWGLTHDGRRLILSDGTAKLHFLDPETYEKTGELVVRDGRRAVNSLNELECVEGEIYANVWRSNRIAVISPGSGRVVKWISLDRLPAAHALNDGVTRVPNGIAYDKGQRRLFVTGKNWPVLYEVEIVSE
ncbi:MAG TPA: glutaminyl-peptide cyclotransferase [Sumerlaeia bacterium]|nr:glutaminyl-peptide cyclotransferase [Sumerlaeia bacterium]